MNHSVFRKLIMNSIKTRMLSIKFLYVKREKSHPPSHIVDHSFIKHLII